MLIKIEVEAETYGDFTTILGAVRDNVIVFCAKRGIEGDDELPDNFGMQQGDNIDFSNCPGTFEIIEVIP